MRKKTLAAIAPVYTAICLSYGAFSGINLPIADSSSATEKSASVTSSALQSQTSESSDDPSTTGRKKRHGRGSGYEQSSTYEDGSGINSQEDAGTAITGDSTSDVPTLNEYLKNLKCGGCGHGCNLLNPRCMRGARKQSSATEEYNEIYG